MMHGQKNIRLYIFWLVNFML